MTSETWNPAWSALSGQTIFDSAHQQVVAVSRTADTLDLFATGDDGHIYAAAWARLAGWSEDWLWLPGQTVSTTAHQQVTAVSRSADTLDLFVIGDDGHVYAASWDQSAGWSQDGFQWTGPEVFDVAHQHVAAVSQSADRLDLFVIGDDGHVVTTAWTQDNGWTGGWSQPLGKEVFDAADQQVTVVPRASGLLDLFVIGDDGRVWTTFGSTADWFPLPGPAEFDVTQQRVAVVAGAAGRLDLFAVSTDGRVWSTSWDAQTGWNETWEPLPGFGVFDGHQHVAAVSAGPDRLDLFAIGSDQQVWSTFRNAKGWNADWFRVSAQPGQLLFDATQQQVTAVSREPGQVDLFVLGSDRRAWVTSGRVG
jgi:hypothetical protein